MRCSSFQKNLSAFLDDELDPRKRRQMELHLSECADCRREAEKLRDMITLMGTASRPEVPAYAWEGTRQRIEAALGQPERVPIFRIPRRVVIPAAAAVFAILLALLSSQMFFYRHEAGPMPFSVYLQEYELSYSQQVLPQDLLSGLTVAQTEEVTAEDQSDETTSELEMLMEVHYGTYSTNGS